MELNSASNKSILFAGMLTGPGCGELNGNLQTCKLLLDNFSLITVDTNLLTNVNDIEKVGLITKNKIVKTIAIITKAHHLARCNIAYLVPGQTFGGVLKFLPFAILAKALNKTIIYHFHGARILDTFREQKYFKKWIISLFLKLSNINFVLTGNLKADFAKQLPLKGQIIVLPNFVDQQSHIERNNQGVLSVLFFSNFMIEKGVIDFIDAAISLSKTNKFKFFLAGGGSIEMINKIKELIKGHSSIELVGYVEGETKEKLLASCHIYVLPTYYSQEGLPISMLECMSYGQVVVSCKQGGISDVIIEGVNGFYVNKQDYSSIVDALLNIEVNRDILNIIKANNIKAINQSYSKNAYREILISNI